MSTFYWDESLMQNDNKTPSILAFGDSWFWYLLPGGSLINYLGPMVGNKSHTILAKGGNGAEADQFVNGKYAKIFTESLRGYGAGLSAVFLSAGGNDFAGFPDLRPLLEDDCSGKVSERDCYRSGKDGLQGLMDKLEEDYRKLIGLIYTHTKPACKIIMHTYDYAIPNGKGVFGGEAWLKPALESAKVPSLLQAKCVMLLIDSCYEMLTRIAKTDKSHLIVVDSRGTLSAREWANELHPTGGGFKKIAKQAWEPILKAQNLA